MVIEVAAFFSPDAKRLWRRVGRRDLSQWIEAVARCAVRGRAVGAERRVALAGSIAYVEVLEFAASGRQRWRFTEPPPGIGAGWHELNVYDDEPGKTVALWRGTFSGTAPASHDSADAIAAAYRAGFTAAGGWVAAPR